MELKKLESLLGVKYDYEVQGRKSVILPAKKWELMSERVNNTGTTHLMQASRDGTKDCVDLLLRCGADVNASDKKGRRAIDYSLDGDHQAVMLSLLMWDSFLPFAVQKAQNKAIIAQIRQNNDINQFFMERDNFHKLLLHGKSGSFEEILRKSEDNYITPRYWVNSSGESALYTAAKGWKYDTWALLRASGFQYASNEEKEDVGVYETDDAFLCAIGKHFVELNGCHVQKMVAKSKVYKREGVKEDGCGEKVENYFKSIDGEEYASSLLKCLQDDPSLEIIFDFASTDIQCMHPIGKQSNVWGLTDFKVNRIYVAAKETEEFGYFDVVSNLVHELTHKSLEVVFENGGLPFRVGDTDVKNEYIHITEKVLSDEHKKYCDTIIQRVAGTAEVNAYELIVRVPEMIVKYTDQVHRSIPTENGFSRLRRQAPDLLDFYKEQVHPEICRHVLRNKTANKVVRSELLRYNELLTANFDKRIQVIGSINDILTFQHNQLRVMSVSNLKLGVSHLRSLLEEVTFVDWTQYLVASDYFNFAVNRNVIKTLAIIWDERDMPPFFCHSSLCNDFRCIGRQLEVVVHRLIFIVPKKFSIHNKVKCFNYTWNDLSSDSKNWILEKILDFGGIKIKVRDVVGSITGSEAIESVMGELMEAEELSMVIDQDNIQLGRSLQSTVKERGFELLRSHPESFMQRRLRVRSIVFNKEVLERRKNDAFFIRNADESDLKEAGIDKMCVWDESNIPDGCQCFILDEEPINRNECNIFRGMFETLRASPCDNSVVRRWHFVHFFTLKKIKYNHDYSLNFTQVLRNSADIMRLDSSGIDLLKYSDFGQNEALIIADAPGSGKSVFMNEMACRSKKNNPKCWIEVVELPLFEKEFKQWREADLESHEKVIDFLYELIKLGDSKIERKLFKLFCQSKRKTFIFFDAFDEICPNYKEKLTIFIKALKYGTNVKVCLATRTHESADLEDHLHTLSYKFVPFNRSQQVKFLNSEWKSSIKSLSQGERIQKVQSIISGLQSHCNLKCDREISNLIENLKMLLEKDKAFCHQDISFVKLAEKLIENGKFIVRGEGDFSETPLHAWMFASVAFEENFSIENYLSLHQLYKRFVNLKIDLYSREKAKAHEHVAGDSKEELFKLSTYNLLKKFSAFFFLEEKDYQLRMHEIPHILRIGVVIEISGSITFVHRTFGEYLFSLWLLEKARKEKVTNVLLHQVLLENKFEKVRQFIDNLLLSEYEKKSSEDEEEWIDYEKSLLSHSAISTGEMFVESVQKCLYTSISENHEGIFQYLVESSGECVAEVIFGKPHWDMEKMKTDASFFTGIRDGNALTICGNLIKNSVWHSYVQSPQHPLCALKFLSKLLRLVEKHELTTNLNQMILEEGVWWMGVYEKLLWKYDDGKRELSAMLEYLAKYGHAFPLTMKNGVFEHGELITNIAVNSFEILVSLSDAVFIDDKDFLEIFLNKESFFIAWSGVVEKCGVEKVEKMWKYFGGKHLTRQSKRDFLWRKNQNKRNALFAACMNVENPNVFPFVWELCRLVMDEEECKAFLFDTFRGVKDPNECIGSGFFKWLCELHRSEFLTEDEVTHLLLNTNDGGTQYYLLSIHNYYSPHMVYTLQDLLLTGCCEFEVILWHMEDRCNELAPLCFRPTRWPTADSDFESIIESEFVKLISSLQPSPFVDPIYIDDQGYLLYVQHWNKTRVKAIRLKAYLVLLRRQLYLHERILGRNQLLEMLKGEWFWIYFQFPELLMKEQDGGELKKTDAFLIPYFFIILNVFLSRDQVAEFLLHDGDAHRGTAFHWALFQSDHRAFHRLYDIARWSMGEDSLCRVHSAIAVGDGTTVLQMILKKEELF